MFFSCTIALDKKTFAAAKVLLFSDICKVFSKFLQLNVLIALLDIGFMQIITYHRFYVSLPMVCLSPYCEVASLMTRALNKKIRGAGSVSEI